MPTQHPCRVVRATRRAALLTVLLLASCAASLAPHGSTAVSASNPISTENELPGTTAWIVTNPAKNHQIEGYASTVSALVGQTISFSVSTTAPTFTAQVYRMGWYGGAGARLVDSIPAVPGQHFPIPAADPSTGMITATWPSAFQISIPSSWVSGVYMVKLIASTGYQSYIPFVVRDTRPSAFLFVRAVATDQAYNDWGGKSLYGDDHYAYGSPDWSSHRARKVSYNRPFAPGLDVGSGLFFHYEYDMVRWLEKNGYDVSYLTDIDIDEDPALVLKHRGILSAGHDEYWSKRQYDGLQGAVTNGVSLGVFGANTGIWQVRYESLSGVPDRAEVCYRVASDDPLNGVDNSQVTVKWADPPLDRPASELLGEGEGGINSTPASWVVTANANPLFSGTGVNPGSSLPGLVGYEYDHIGSWPHPSNVIILATSPVVTTSGQSDVSNSTAYTAPSGALVLDMGSIDWAWVFDNTAPPFVVYPYGQRPTAADSRGQMFAANVLAASAPMATASPTPVSGGTAASPTPSSIASPSSTSVVIPSPTSTSLVIPSPTSSSVVVPSPVSSPAAALRLLVSGRVRPGMTERIAIVGPPGATVHIRVQYPNGDHQSAHAVIAASGNALYSYVQGASKITHNRYYAQVRAYIGSGPDRRTATGTYKILFGRIDVSVEPRHSRIGRVVDIWIHTAPHTAVAAYLLSANHRSVHLYGQTGQHAWTDLKWNVARALKGRGKTKVTVVARITSRVPHSSTKTSLMIQ